MQLACIGMASQRRSSQASKPAGLTHVPRFTLLAPSLCLQEYERCLKYIFPSCSKKARRHIDQTFAIMDVKVGGAGLHHDGRCLGEAVAGCKQDFGR